MEEETHIPHTPVLLAMSSEATATDSSSAACSADTIDCLSVPPPYSTQPPARHSRRLQPRRSLSVENILDYDNEANHRSKVCCSTALCQYCLSGCLMFRRVLVLMTIVGIMSLVGAVVLGAARNDRNNFLTLSLMFAGLGLVLITVVIIGWRCTPPDHEPCHLLFGLGSFAAIQRRPFFGRRRGRRSSRFHWLGDRLFPEFRYRAPPPTYAASMHDYNQSPTNLKPSGAIPKTPPPAYKLYNSQRHRARKGVHIIYPRLSTDPHCLPPLYREQTGNRSSRRLTIQPNINLTTTGTDNQAFMNETVATSSSSQSGVNPSSNGVVLPQNQTDLQLMPTVDSCRQTEPTDGLKAETPVDQNSTDSNKLVLSVDTEPIASNPTKRKACDSITVSFFDQMGDDTHL